MQLKNKHNLYTCFGIISLFAVFCMFCALLEQIVIVQIDDIMYSNWMRHGFEYFVDKNIWHYNNFSGRVFIHLVMQFITLFNEHLYAFFIPFCIFVSTFLFATIYNKEMKLYEKFFVSAFSGLMFLALDHLFLTESIFWISGGFNYIFPLVIVVLFYFLLLKYGNNNKALFWLLPFAFVAGATTEQYGMYAIGLVILTIFWELIDTKKINKNHIFCLICSAGGLLTILLSPGTKNRAEITGTSNLNKSFDFVGNYLKNFDSLGGANSNRWLPIIFMLVVGFVVLYKVIDGRKNEEIKMELRHQKILILGIPLSILTYLSSANENFAVSALIFTLYILATIVTMFSNKKTRVLGNVLLCGFGTWFMMIISPISIGCRTCVPFILSCIVVVCIMVADTVSHANKQAIAMIVVCFIAFIGIGNYCTSFEGYKESGVYLQNLYNELEQAGQTNCLEYNFDKTLIGQKYRCITLFDTGDRKQFTHYKEKFGISDSVKIKITSEIYNVSSVYNNEKYDLLPAIKLNEKTYIPIQSVYDGNMQIFSITKHISTNSLEIQTQKDTLLCLEEDLTYIVLYNGGKYYMEINTLCNQLGINYIYDEVENTYYLSKNATP